MSPGAKDWHIQHTPQRWGGGGGGGEGEGEGEGEGGSLTLLHAV